MAYSNFINGFKITTRSAIDQRILLTKEEMLKVSQNKQYLVPEIYFALCIDDRKFYLYDNNSQASAETGKYHPIEEFLDFTSAATPAAQEKFETAVENSSAVTSINNILEGSETDPGLINRVDILTDEVNNIKINGGIIE